MQTMSSLCTKKELKEIIIKNIMKLGKHKKTEKGTFRKERKDSSMKKLKEEYPVLKKLNGNIKTLGGAEKALGVNSLSKVIKKARKIKK